MLNHLTDVCISTDTNNAQNEYDSNVVSNGIFHTIEYSAS